VWEWGADSAGDWSAGPRYDPLHARMGETEIAQVARGGCFSSSASELRSDRRRFCNTATRSIGFRVVLDERPAPRGRASWAEAALGGHRYLYYIGEYRWTEAAQCAKDMGGHLVTYDSADEAAHLAPYCKMGRGAYWWLGMMEKDLPLYTRGGDPLTAPANHDETSRMGFIVEFDSPAGEWATQVRTNLRPYDLPGLSRE